jgi:hypothetical protein
MDLCETDCCDDLRRIRSDIQSNCTSPEDFVVVDGIEYPGIFQLHNIGTMKLTVASYFSR